MNSFHFEQILEFSDQVCGYLDTIARKGILGLSMPLSDRFRYELLKFAVFLADADGLIDTKEVLYIRKVLGVESVVADLYTMKKRELIPHQYRLEIPEPIKVAVRIDQRSEYKSPFHRQTAQILLDIMTLFGREFCLLHKRDPSDETKIRFQTYIKGLEDYLEHFHVLYQGKDKKFPIKELEEIRQRDGIAVSPGAGTYPPEGSTAQPGMGINAVGMGTAGGTGKRNTDTSSSENRYDDEKGRKEEREETFAHENAATCGVTMHFGCWSRRLLTSGGSSHITSIAAPPIVPASSASANASSSRTGPRDVLTSIAFGFISFSRRASIRPFVSGVSGQWMLT